MKLTGLAQAAGVRVPTGLHTALPPGMHLTPHIALGLVAFGIGAVTIAAGAIVTVLLLLRIGIGREDRDATLNADPETWAAHVTRRMTGLYVRAPEPPPGTDDGDDPAQLPHHDTQLGPVR